MNVQRASFRWGARTRRAVGVAAIAAGFALASTAVALPAFAQQPTEEQLAAARERFKQGRELEDANEWERARKAFEEVAAVKLTPQVTYHLALCDEHLGKWLDAVDGYEKAIKGAIELGDAGKTVVESATKQRDDLAARMPKLRVEIRGKLEKNDELYVDGKLRDVGLTVRDLKVDPGSHSAEIKRGGEVVASGSVEIAAGERGKLRIELPKEGDGPTEPPKPPPVTGGGVGKIPAYVVGGVGVAALIGSGVTFGMSRAAVDEVRASCGPDGVTGCDPALEPRSRDAETLQTVSLILAGAGVAAVGTGVVLFFVLDDDKSGRAAMTPPPRTVAIAPSLGGFVAAGTF